MIARSSDHVANERSYLAWVIAAMVGMLLLSGTLLAFLLSAVLRRLVCGPHAKMRS